MLMVLAPLLQHGEFTEIGLLPCDIYYTWEEGSSNLSQMIEFEASAGNRPWLQFLSDTPKYFYPFVSF